MQPLKRRSIKANAGAAADYLAAKHGWLRGFPAAGPGATGLGWIQVPPLGARDGAAAFEITAERIRRTEFGLSRAPAKFPSALPRVVGDPIEWKATVEAQLALLKAAFYEGAPWPDLDALLTLQRRRRAVREKVTGLAQARPDLLGLVVALVWMHWREDPPLVRAIDAAGRQADTLEQIAAAAGGADRAMTVRSAQLAAAGVDMAAIAFFAKPYRVETEATTTALLEPIKTYLEVASDAWSPSLDTLALAPWPAENEAGAAVFLQEVVAALADLKGPPLKRAAALFNSVAPIDDATAWAAWREEVRRLRREARTAVADWRAGGAQTDVTSTAPSHPPYAMIITGLRARLATLSAETPAPTPGRSRLRDLLMASRDLAADEGPVLCDAVLKAVRAAKPSLAKEPRSFRQRGANASQETLMSWRRRLTAYPKARDVFAELARLEAALAVLDPSGEAANARRDLIEEAVDIVSFDQPPKRLIAPLLETVRLLGEAIIDQERNAEGSAPPMRRRLDICSARPLLLAGATPAEVAPIVLEIAGWEYSDGVFEDELGELHALCGRDTERLRRLLPHWRGRSDDQEIVRAIQALKAAPGAGPLAVDCVFDGDVKRVLRLARRLALCEALRVTPNPPPTLAGVLDWSRYPAPLHPALHALAAADPNAVAAADAILKTDFPAIEDLETERAAIEVLLATGVAGGREPSAENSLARRLASLAARIETARAGGPEVSPVRLQKYAQKIARRARHARLLRYEEAATAALRHALRERLAPGEALSDGDGAASPAPWFDRVEALDALAALDGLSRAFRTLGWRAVRARQGPKPWDFRDAPKNSAYLRGLERRGVATAPWLDGLAPRSIEGAERPMTLEFEDDPVEILQMGAPFLTCLAPGAFNFFSAVTNAVDVNKRVLYARSADGEIRARCLLALTADGAITPFRVYAHDSAQAVTAAVAELVRELAQAMGVAVVQSHAIPTLEAARWYDDGPVDITGVSALFQDDDALEAWFSERPLASAPAALRERIGAPLLPAHLVALAASAAVRANPERFAPFAPLVGDEATLDPETRLALAEALAGAAQRDQALALLSVFTRASPPQDEYDDASWRGARAAEILLSLAAPSRALRALAVSRPKGVRGWGAESDLRALAAGRALAALHRRNQAAAVLERVLKSHNLNYRAEARRLLDALRAAD